MGSDGMVDLKLWFHPSLMAKLPYPFAPEEQPMKVNSTMRIDGLMQQIEELVERTGEDKGVRCQMQIQVLWNKVDAKRALSPNDTVGANFQSGQTACVYGEVALAQDAQRSIPEADKLPVTILTGFLGAGKTTLLNYILQEQKEKKIAVIENEFGEVSIDDSLLKKDKLALAEKVVVMDNGCMCCTVRGDLVDGLKNIMDEIKKGSKIDQIIIETTGMADPVPIVRTFMTNEYLQATLRLDGVVTVADAKHIIARLDDKVEEGKVNEAYQQVAFCDKMLLNKLDLVTSDEAIRTKERLRDINKFAKILPAVKSRVKMSELTDIRAHDMAHFTEIALEADGGEAEMHGHAGHGDHGGHGGHGEGHGHDEATCTEDHGHGEHGGGDGGGHGSGHGSGHGGGHGHGEPASKKSRHDSRVNSFSIVREGEIIPDRLSKWMMSLGQLGADHGTVFRIKAILAVKGHPNKHVFHAVMDVSDEDDAGEWAPGEKKISKIVFIGKSLDQKFLRDGFEGIFE
jgi:G3E family GTPase